MQESGHGKANLFLSPVGKGIDVSQSLSATMASKHQSCFRQASAGTGPANGSRRANHESARAKFCWTDDLSCIMRPARDVMHQTSCIMQLHPQSNILHPATYILCILCILCILRPASSI